MLFTYAWKQPTEIRIFKHFRRIYFSVTNRGAIYILVHAAKKCRSGTACIINTTIL